MWGGSGSSSVEVVPQTKTGVFLDSAVEGVKYKTSSGLEGYTNAKGEYKFNDGDTVEFLVGDVSLGKTKASSMLTTDNFPFPAQVAQFLQTLDSDGIPDNGIQIVKEFHTVPLFQKATLKEDNASNFAKDLKLSDFDASSNNQLFINNVTLEAGILDREIISESDAFEHKQKSEKLKRIKENNPEFYSYIDGTFDAKDIPTYSNIHENLQSRLAYYFYDKFYKNEISSKYDIYLKKAESKQDLQLEIEKFADNYLSISGLSTEIAIYTSDVILDPNDQIDLETKRRIIGAIKSSGSSEVYGFAFANSPEAKEVVEVIEDCIGSPKFIEYIKSFSIDGVVKELVGDAAGKVIDCGLNKTVTTTSRFINSIGGRQALTDYYSYKIASYYLEIYYMCGTNNTECREKQFNNWKSRQLQIQYIQKKYDLDIGNDIVSGNAQLIILDYISTIKNLTKNIVTLLPSDEYFNEGNKETNHLRLNAEALQLSLNDEGILWLNINLENITFKDIYLTSFTPKFIVDGQEFTVASDFYGIWGSKLFDRTFNKFSSTNNIRIPISLNNNILPQTGMARLVLEVDYMSTDRVFSDTIQRVVDLDLAELWNSTKMAELDAKLISISKTIDSVYMKEKVYLPDIYLGQIKIVDLNDIKWQVNAMSYDAKNIIIHSDAKGFYINAPILKDGFNKDIVSFTAFLSSSPYSEPVVFALNVLRFINTPPVATAQIISLNQNTSKNVVLSGSDENNDSLTYTVVSNPTNGTLSGTAPNLTYTPTAGYSGTDSFTFKVNDGTVDSSVATVSITVNATSTASSTIKKTGQIKSYNVYGIEITDGSLKDDGYYKKGQTPRYTRASDMVTDELTGLMWQDDTDVATVTKPWVTQANYNAGDYSNTSGDTATTYCSTLSLGGNTDWRLPTSTELEGIVDYGKRTPAIDSTYFNNVISGGYWSSTTYEGFKHHAFVVYFYSGYVSNGSKSDSSYVRCVRDGQ